MMTPAEWHQAWPLGHLIPPRDQTYLPPGVRSFVREYGLPHVIVFEPSGGSRPFEWRFHPIEKELVPFTRFLVRSAFDAPDDARLEELWSDQLVLAEEEFCNGNAAICVHAAHEYISRFDWEKDSGEFVNSGISPFAESMLAIVAWCGKHGRRPVSDRKAALPQLFEALGRIDPAALTGAHSLAPLWPMLIEGVIMYEDTERCDITSDPNRSKSRF